MLSGKRPNHFSTERLIKRYENAAIAVIGSKLRAMKYASSRVWILEPSRRSRRSRRSFSKLRSRMKLKTTKAAKLSDESAYRSNVSEPVSGGTTAHTLKSCCATMIASSSKTKPPSSHGTVRRRLDLRTLLSSKLLVGLLTRKRLD